MAENKQQKQGEPSSNKADFQNLEKNSSGSRNTDAKGNLPKEKQKVSDIFINKKIYPDAKGLFSFSPKSVDEIKNDCVFVLDTNALLLPYKTGSDDLAEIGRIYETLKEAGRLFIPEQVAREFVKNRPERLKDLYSSISAHSASKVPDIHIHPILKQVEGFDNIQNLKKEINKSIRDYNSLVTKLKESIKGWFWNDPVSELYNKLFSEDVIIELQKHNEELKSDLVYRYDNMIPPGYKDASKPDSGIGDLAIWYTLLQLGSQGKDIIFVSDDSKNDWYHQSNNEALYPRFDLLHEFHRVTGGRSINLIHLSHLLRMFDANQEVIDNVQAEENAAPKRELPSDFVFRAFTAVFDNPVEIGFIKDRVSINGYSDVPSGTVDFPEDAIAIQIICIAEGMDNASLEVLNRFCQYLINEVSRGFLYIITPVGPPYPHIFNEVSRVIREHNVDVRYFYGCIIYEKLVALDENRFIAF